MTTITLWLLIFVGSQNGTSAPRGAPSQVVERFASEQECVRVQKLMAELAADNPRLRCIQATVARP